MLRSQLGDELYRKCILTYLEQHKFGNVVTEDLARVVEELSGRSYDQFFDQWVYHAHYPEIDAGYSWDEKDKLAKISIRQTQEPATRFCFSIFHWPLRSRPAMESSSNHHRQRQEPGLLFSARFSAAHRPPGPAFVGAGQN